MSSTSTDANPVINRTSIDTAASVHSITDSILSLYGHESIYVTPSDSEGEVLGTRSMQSHQARVSRTIEEYIRKSPVLDLDGPGSPLISPCTSQFPFDPSTASNDEARQGSLLTSHCTSKYSLVSKTLINDISGGNLEVEYFNHLAATELGILTDFCVYYSNQHQYDSKRDLSGLFLRDGRGITLIDSYIQVASFFDKGKKWRCHKFVITLPRQGRYQRPGKRPMMIFYSRVRRLPLYDSYRLRVRYPDPDKRAMGIPKYLTTRILLPDAYELRRRGAPVMLAYVNYVLNNIEYTYLINRDQNCHEVLAIMLQAVDDRLVASSYELCLNSHGTSRLSMDQKPFALYQECLREGLRPLFLIRLKDAANT